jgi:hypothetical protein
MAVNFRDGRLFLKKVSSVGVETVIALNDYQNIYNAPTKLSEFINDAGFSANTALSLIKTFNILNEFSAPLLGKSVYVPISNDVIRSVQLTNSRAVGSDLMVGLYRNNELLNFFTIPAGNYIYKYTGLNYAINTNDYLTVNVVAGSGENFSLVLLNTDT